MARYTTYGLNIPQLTILAGLLMSLWGLDSSYTPISYGSFPTLFGLLLITAGIVSIVRPDLNALSMHLAVFTSLSQQFWVLQRLYSMLDNYHIANRTTDYVIYCHRAPFRLLSSSTMGNPDFRAIPNIRGRRACPCEKKRNPGPASVVAISVE